MVGLPEADGGGDDDDVDVYGEMRGTGFIFFLLVSTFL